jgi:hypothetical protein
MIEPPELSLFSLCVFGGGGLVIALVGLLAGWLRPGTAGPGLAPALLVLIGIGVASTSTGGINSLGWPSLSLAALLLLTCAIRSDRLGRALRTAWGLARRPRFQWMTLAVGCPAVAVVLAVLAGPARTARQPPPRAMPSGSAVTDRGFNVFVSEAVGGPGPVAILQMAEARALRATGLSGRVIQVAPADWTYNCHGWVLSDGRYLIPDESVELVLRDNGYQRVEQPRAGDLVVYRDERGSICHTAVVRAVGESGWVLLESKWAWMGRYLHQPDATPFGQQWTCYRSPRAGHLLRAPGSPPGPTSARHLLGPLPPVEPTSVD